MLKRRKESDTYLAADRRHRWSTQITMKVDKCVAFSRHCGLSLQLMKAAVPAESYTLIQFHRDLRTPTMTSVSSQVGVALFPSFFTFKMLNNPGLMLQIWVKEPRE